jgi:hypothetical protein
MRGILFAAVVALSGLLGAVNISSAQTWTQTMAQPSTYVSIAASADGSKLVAGGTAVYISTNSGSEWISNNLPAQSLVYISADGMKMVAINNLVIVSTNAGATWSTNATFLAYSLAASADGSKMVAINNASGAIISTNYGTSWKSSSAPANKVVMSADGTQCYFFAYDTTNMFVSTNLGTSWKRTATPGIRTLSLAISADGKKLVAGTSPGPIYISTNSGNSWAPTTSPITNWFFVTSSADGSRLMGASRASPGISGPIYTSSNSGAYWVSNNIVNLWSGLATSADGGELLAINPNNVFMAKASVSPQINVAALNNNETISWIVPSTNLVLQQSFDLASWSVVTNPPVLNYSNLQYQVSLASTNSSGFFRLISQ